MKNLRTRRWMFGSAAGILLVSALAAFADVKILSESATVFDSPKGKEIGKVLEGAKADYLRLQGEHVLISFEGWAHRSAFVKVPSLLARVKILEVADEQAELKSDPGSGRAVGRIFKSSQPEMRDIKGKWVKVGINGWIAASAMNSAKSTNPRVKFSTTEGDFVVELDRKNAPKTVANILSYVEKGFYEGTIFHRVIPTFMIQGGGFDKDYKQKPNDPPVPIESNNGLKNTRGTVAMARTNDPNSATSQFFVNVVDNGFLNYQSDQQPGYTVFGRVIEGMETVDKIRNIPTGPGGPLPSDVPQTMVVITKASKVE